MSSAAAFTPAAHAVSRMPRLPRPRGDASDALLRALSVGDAAGLAATPVRPDDPLADDDLHLALFLAYELHYRGLPGVDDEREWDPDVLGFRRRLERVVEDALR
ncbi:MAG TPA: iron-containing redox enzyme family protein, partial [Actinomycetota bacterium]